MPRAGTRAILVAMQSKATTPEQYLASLPDDRRAALSAVRAVFKKHLDRAYEERMSYGMIGYCIPHSVYPAGYHCDPKQPLPFAGLASQKGHMSLYLMGLYIGEKDGDGETEEAKRFRAAWTKDGRKLDMGKACVRFKKLEDVPLDVLAGTLRRLPAKEYIARYEAVLAKQAAGKGARAKPAAKAGAARGAKKPATRPTGGKVLKMISESSAKADARGRSSSVKDRAATRAASSKRGR